MSLTDILVEMKSNYVTDYSSPWERENACPEWSCRLCWLLIIASPLQIHLFGLLWKWIWVFKYFFFHNCVTWSFVKRGPWRGSLERGEGKGFAPRSACSATAPAAWHGGFPEGRSCSKGSLSRARLLQVQRGQQNQQPPQHQLLVVVCGSASGKTPQQVPGGGFLVSSINKAPQWFLYYELQPRPVQQSLNQS